MKGTEYKRLPGRRVAWTSLGRRSLWLGPDHLLSITNRGYSEEYKRFYYRDIQAFVLTQTSAWMIGNFVFGGISAFFLLLTSAGRFLWRWPNWATIPLAVFGGFWLLVFLIHLLRGETCMTVIRTAVQAERLPSLNRFATAKRAIQRIQVMVEQAQGRLDIEQIQAAAPPPFPTNDSIGPKTAMPEAELRHYSSNIHAVLFLQLLAFSVLSFGTIFYSGLFSYVLISIVYLSIVITLLLALMRQNKSDLNKRVKGIAWSAFAFLWIFTVAAYGYALFLMVDSTVNGMLVSLLQLISETSPMESKPLLFLHVFSAVFCFGLGISGLIFLRQFQSRPDKHQTGDVIA
jgi:hypothetical protein